MRAAQRSRRVPDQRGAEMLEAMALKGVAHRQRSPRQAWASTPPSSVKTDRDEALALIPVEPDAGPVLGDPVITGARTRSRETAGGRHSAALARRERRPAPAMNAPLLRRCVSPRKARGFTLIELMITVVIVTILAVVALPTYTDYVRRARRADAQSFLSHVVAQQQHFLLDRRAYATSVSAAPASGGLGLAIPNDVSAYYSVTMVTSNSAPPSFTITATPQGAQSLERCGTLSITNAGSKSAAVAGCW